MTTLSVNKPLKSICLQLTPHDCAALLAVQVDEERCEIVTNSHKDGQRRIAFQGELGAYSHRAAKSAFPNDDVLPCPSFDDALAAVSERDADLAMIPIENSTAGRVADIHTLLPNSGLSIIGEQFEPIRHCLLAVQGTTVDDLREVTSHVQALGQCRATLRALNLSPVVFADTAGAARRVSEIGDKTVGAIASDLAAEVYGLQILKRDIQDNFDNTTRFVTLARDALDPKEIEGDALTSLTFETRNVPAALFKALGCFATNGVNITKLESYYEGERFAVSEFYIELAGKPGDEAVDEALRELTFQAKHIRMLGSFPQSLARA